MAYVNPEHAKEGSELSVLLVGKRTKATVEANSLYDPEHALPRGLIYYRKTKAYGEYITDVQNGVFPTAAQSVGID